MDITILQTAQVQPNSATFGATESADGLTKFVQAVEVRGPISTRTALRTPCSMTSIAFWIFEGSSQQVDGTGKSRETALRGEP